MKLTKYEKIILIFLSVTLLAGAAILYKKHSRPYRKITIIEGGIKEEFSLEQVERKLKESRRININTAGAEEITIIPGIGEVLATRIVEYRDAYGDFYRVESLLQVEGIGENKLEKIKEYIKL